MATREIYYCGKERRLEAVKDAGLLNGIEFVEISANQKRLVINLINAAPATFTKDNFKIVGGSRISSFDIVLVSLVGKVVTIEVDEVGDFSYYELQIRDGAGYPVGFDPQLCDVSFSFKVNCPSPLDCKVELECAEVAVEEPPLDYLAKDFQSFRRLMIERLTLSNPGWKQHSLADQQTAFVELLAYVADYLSYAQDSISTEAYLGKARKRTSIRRHARLLDYFMHEGCNARTAVCVEVIPGSTADGSVIAPHTPFLTAENGTSFEVSLADYSSNFNQENVVFESMHELKISADRNKIKFHTWSDFDCCLPKGATSATVVNDGSLVLTVGDYFAIYESIHPESLDYRDARKSMRHLVRLTSVVASQDLHEGIDVYEIAWDSADALPFTFCLSKTDDENAIPDMTLACANVVIADMGKTAIQIEKLIPEKPEASGTYRPTLQSNEITFSTPFDSTIPATKVLQQSANEALPALTLSSPAGIWIPQRDTLNSTAFDRHFVVETEEDRSVRLRFGDNTYAKKPGTSDDFDATVRTGSGTQGNIGADVLSRIVTSSIGILKVWNLIPGMNGTSPEPILDVKRFAPHAFKTQKRLVTEQDYKDICEKFPGVQGVSVDMRWTGSWLTAFLAIDRVGGLSVTSDPEFIAQFKAYLSEFRMDGIDFEIRDPIRVPLIIRLNICVKDGWFRSNVLKDLARAFSSGITQDGSLGFFHPDNFTFGADVYASQVIAAAMEVNGVDHVRLIDFHRSNFAPAGELGAGRISIGKQEIAQLTGDRNFPEQGRMDFILEGGL